MRYKGLVLHAKGGGNPGWPELGFEGDSLEGVTEECQKVSGCRTVVVKANRFVLLGHKAMRVLLTPC